ncbi:hypothetical protein F5884DRAFT_446736 [Xylogone sp. PMI_703]|nr:hypothetical protein F5884DRAFT_446736 [Xylogone sp. PMI_703]
MVASSVVWSHMVGAAGKSQACNTCKKRRVECDLTRPSCLKCTKSNRVCDGYSRDLISVNRTPSDPSSTAASASSEINTPRLLKDLSTEANLRFLLSKSSHSSRDFRCYAVGLLKDTYLPRKPLASSYNVESSERGFSWVYHLAGLMEPSKALDTALFAFCLAQLHVTGKGNHSLYQCLDHYNVALHHLHSELGDPDMQMREETVAAILVLSTCELFMCPTEHGWSIHVHGIAEILRLRNPKTASTLIWQHLFSRLRVVCTLSALTQRQAHLLENDIWRRIEFDSGFRDVFDEVFRMVADVPALLERVAALPSIKNQDVLLSESATVAQSLLAMVQYVKSWHEEFWKASPNPRAWLVPSCASNPADTDPSNKIFPFCFDFESLSVAVTVTVCWSVGADLYSNIIQIHDLIQARLGRRIEFGSLLVQANTTMIDSTGVVRSSNQNTQLSNIDKDYSIREIQREGTNMARYVCQSMEYYHQIEMGTYGSQVTRYPSWSARQYFRLHPGHEREWSWIQNMHKMEGPGTRWGLSTMAFADITEPLCGWPR